MDYPLKDFAVFAEHNGAKIGLLIKCPNCGMRMSAWFKVPIGGGEPMDRVQWDRTGDTLENITLHPSFGATGHYHSWIRNGMLCVDSAFECVKET
jgi:hypothetical protein